MVRPSDIVGGDGPGPLLTALTEDDVEDFDFCMTNPPFFASEDEVFYVIWFLTSNKSEPLCFC